MRPEPGRALPQKNGRTPPPAMRPGARRGGCAGDRSPDRRNAFYDEIVIGKGSSDGVKKQDLVINELGVIGIVKDVNKHSSIVELLTNSDLELSVKINNSYGILESSDKEIIVKNIKLDQEITVGDDVYTSGLTKIPGDIYIGKVKEIKKDNLELEYIIKVDAINYLEDITYVAVIGEAK